MSTEYSDEEIALRVQRGESHAFGLLMERYEQKLLRFGRKFLYDSEDVKDLVQDIFIKAYVNIQSFDTSRKFSPWIYRIAHNAFINAIKKKSNERVSSFDLDVLFPHPVAKETADSDAYRHSMRAMLDACLGKLNAKYREPLVLYYFEEMGYKEIADILHIPVSTVGVRLTRGKALLKTIMDQVDPTYVTGS